jgi:hypothetical protein
LAGQFNVTGVWSAVGVMLFLIAMYLVLTHASGAAGVLGALFNGGGNLAATLQGR